MPSTFAVASAGAMLPARPRRRISAVLDAVIATVPANPAMRPFPIAQPSLEMAVNAATPPEAVQSGHVSR